MLLQQTNPGPQAQPSTAKQGKDVDTIFCVAGCSGAGPVYQVNCSSSQTTEGKKKRSKKIWTPALEPELSYIKQNGMHSF